MSPELIFKLHLLFGYVVWLLCTGVYFLPKLKTMDRIDAQRTIAAPHSFRFLAWYSSFLASPARICPPASLYLLPTETSQLEF